jgi:hypothetical protein
MPVNDESAEVNAFLTALTHPQKEGILTVREWLREADPRLTEHIKWNAPSYALGGDHRITFNLHGKGFFRLVFHLGVKDKETKTGTRRIADPTGWLEWASDSRALLRFAEGEDLQERRDGVMELVREWVD